MENLEIQKKLSYALENDPKVKSWIAPNEVLFPNSGENSDLFLTTYRIRNAYEILLKKLQDGEEVKSEKDLVLVNRYFEMCFYPPMSMNLTSWKEGRNPSVKIVKAYKDKRWKGNRRRSHEITLRLSDGKKIQIDPGKIISKFLYTKRMINGLSESNF
jgi:hypothetical protein